MSHTATEKMLQSAGGVDNLTPGDTVEVDVDVSWVHETQLEIFKEKFEEVGGDVWDDEKCMFMIDHFPTPTSQDQADRLKELRAYAEEKGVEVVSVGIKHQAWRMLGIGRPGAIMAGPDSHTPTAGALGALSTCVGPTDTALVWKTGRLWVTVPETIRFDINGELNPGVTIRDVGFAILEEFGKETSYFANNCTVEYAGDTVSRTGLDGRQTLCNMGTEMGVTNAYIEPDDRLRKEYLEPKVKADYEIFTTDEGATFTERHEIDVNDLAPKVAFPHSPSNVRDVDEAVGIQLDQLFLGSCANGHLDDLRVAADILAGDQVHPDVELIVTPATDEIRKQASEQGIINTFIQSGARVSSGYCSVCPGYEGILAKGDVCLSTSTRNYRGRMGHRESEIYLCSPATLAASAIKGEITDPRTGGR